MRCWFGRSMTPRRSRSAAALAAAALMSAGLLASSVGEANAEEFECLVEPYDEIEIGSPLPGVLGEVRVERGDRVTKGQVVAMLESSVEQADLALAQAKAEFAARKVERNDELYRKRMISIHQTDEMATEMDLLQLEAAQAQARLERRTIRSPIDGVVVKRHLSPGEYVQDEGILTVAQIDPLRVEVAVPARLHGLLRVGIAGQVTWEIPRVGRHTAPITVVDPVIDAASGTIGVRLELPNPDHRLPAGTKCTVQLPVAGGGATAAN